MHVMLINALCMFITPKTKNKKERIKNPMNKQVKIIGKILDQILHTWAFSLINVFFKRKKKGRAEKKFSDLLLHNRCACK